LINSILKCLI